MSKNAKTSFEPLDYEELDVAPTNDDDDKSDRPDDFMGILVDKMYNFDWVLLILVAIIFLVVISDVYGEGVLRRIDGTFNNDEITIKGHMMQLVGLISGSILGRALFAIVGI